MKILITGTAGFIGFHLAKKLLERGDTVIGLDNINDYYDVNLKYARLEKLGIRTNEIKDNVLVQSVKFKNHHFIKTNLEDATILDELFKNEKFDAVCNLAAQAGVRYSIENPHAYISSNINGFMNILEACRHFNVHNLAYASSSSVYGLNQSQPFKTDECADHPVSLYAATKKSNELMAHAYSHLYGIQTTGLRFFTVYGPFGRPDMAPMLFAKAIINDEPIKVFNNGEMSRDFTYIDDIVDGIIKVIDSPAKRDQAEYLLNGNLKTNRSLAPYRIYNIGNNKPVALLDFIEELEKNIGKKAIKNFMPMQDGDVKSTYADTDDLNQQFNYKPNTHLADGIQRFIDWHKDFYGTKNETFSA